MPVVFDTNVFVSALTFPGGRGDQALERVIEGPDSLAISKAIIDEVLIVLARKFARDREELARVGVFLHELADVVEPSQSIDVLADPPDNRILECAVAADAQTIVTGDRAMLALEDYQGTRIVSLREYLG